ncbi:DUF1240 domain-containing protein [Morganella morganii]|uniref:DUF1240 domain-containing protein n=3 Tax=Morganella TaxID=581 RepID=UPI001C40DD36|nr:DUF1240 domain-containing protein [Morganella morganii]ELA9087642.1 DUF1240 domain-containing protein [Morganella morganii]MCU6231811.1 DUF1240 domain-containing protein [Morganella morganii]MCU6377680.1 DUF1240 domain-containing protein [Morganella morganii]HBH7054421.1 DUF1240 domain-containing protein [Morganella morganii]HEI9843362.1 DUF1240 domain-containing protein [Morganella morganii]
MDKFSPKKRVLLVFFDLIIILMTIVTFYLGIDGLSVYFSYPDIFVFSHGIALLFSFITIAIPVILLSLSPILKGRQASITFQKKVAKIMMLGLVLMATLTFIFNLYYLSTIDSKGYVKCNGTPSGWMPMMATKYVTDKKLCLAPKK